MDLNNLIDLLKPVVLEAGYEIMKVYRNGAKAEYKDDGSPVTIADKLSEEIILNNLKTIAPSIPIVSEENTSSHINTSAEKYFLVDPLDGTKEFLDFNGSGEFTVNIGLISNNKAIMGIIYAPNLRQMYYGLNRKGSFFENKDGEILSINVNKNKSRDIIAIASKKHQSLKTEQWLAERNINNIISARSSLQFCAIAKGNADVYPRFSPTMEWDIAAGDAILSGAGGRITIGDSKTPISYGKPNYKNSEFIAWSGLKIV